MSDGKEVAISGIRSYNVEPTKVYNFEVADNHTYFVGEDGVLVHNYDILKNVHKGLRQLAEQHNESFYDTNDPILKLYHSLGIAVYETADFVLPPSDVEAGKDILTLGSAVRPIGFVTETGVNLLKSKLAKQVMKGGVNATNGVVKFTQSAADDLVVGLKNTKGGNVTVMKDGVDIFRVHQPGSHGSSVSTITKIIEHNTPKGPI